MKLIDYVFIKLNSLDADIHELLKRAEKSELCQNKIDLDCSDSFMILSVNSNTNKTVMTNVPRDTQANIIDNDTK